MKLTIYTCVLALAFLFAGCSTTPHHPKVDAEHHHHVMDCEGGKCEMKTKECNMKSCDVKDCQMYDKHCAYSVSHGKMDVKGKDDYKLKHKSHTYYFSSEEKMKKFEEKLEENIKKADKNWLDHSGGILR